MAENFFKNTTKYIVIGASKDRSKYGNKVLMSYINHGLPVQPVHPKETEVEGIPVVKLEDVENPASCGVSIVTPPAVTLGSIVQAASLGFKYFWLQPGSESPEVLKKVSELDISCIAGGPCVLVSLNRGEHQSSKV